ncbi:MAG: hypothetical protein G8345_14430 [Magnetococcales bacterium]|nr:hypothetical protein [Magnetococcales bacterium]NGZ28072.1 hypothetical protein [Magnetococcales bacterium]
MRAFFPLLLLVGVIAACSSQPTPSPQQPVKEEWKKEVGGPNPSLDEQAAELNKYGQDQPGQAANKKTTVPKPADNPLERLDNQLRAIDSQRR